MKLSEWTDRLAFGGSEEWARNRVRQAIQELVLDEDPVCFAAAQPPSRERRRLSVTLWAALALGFARISLATDPVESGDATISMALDAWSAIAASLRLESVGDAEGRLPVTLVAGDQRIESGIRDRGELIELFRECVRQVALH